MTGLFNLLLLPFRGLNPLAGLMGVSLVLGIVMILIFKHASNQSAIGDLRRRMGSRALGMLLHLHSPVAVARMGASLMLDNFFYLWMILRPMLIIAVPFVVTAAQLDARYGREPVPGETPVTVTVNWMEMPGREGLELSGTGLTIHEPVIFIDSLGETSFRVSSGEPGARITVNGTQFPVGASWGWPGSVVYRGASRAGPIPGLVTPFNAGIPHASPVESVTIHLPDIRFPVFGRRWSWLAVLLAGSTLSAVLGAVVFRVKV